MTDQARPIQFDPDFHLVIEPPLHLSRLYARNPGELHTAYQNWADSFIAALRDHRSMDGVTVEVEEYPIDVCSICGEDWNPIDDHGKKICDSCSSPIANEPEELA